MDRIVEVKVNGNYIRKDNKNAGVQGECNMTALRIEFDEGWDGFAKTITWWNSRNQNPVQRTLTADLLEDITQSTRIYLVLIPGEPMEYPGECSFVIDGYVNDKRQRSVQDVLVVKPAESTDNAGTPADPTPSQAEQLQVQIDSIMDDIQEAGRAASAAVEAAESAMRAETAASEAESYSSNPPVVNYETGYWMEWDGEQYVDTEHYSVGPRGIQGDPGVRGEQGVQGVQGASGPQGAVGPRGPQGIQGPEGPRGFSGVAVQTAGYVNFSVTEDGILQCIYTGDEAPDYSINEDGHLILTV